MAKVSVYNLNRESVGELDLNDGVFGADVNEALMHDVLKAQLASKRSGSANTKVRSEVAGSARKVFRQKGTGNARHGSIRAAIYVGGGKAHGPKPRSFAYRPPRKMRLGAMRSALSLKLKEGNLTVVESFDLPEVKTRGVVDALKALQLAGTLIIDAKENEKLRLSVRNLAKSQFLPPEGVNLYDLLRHEHIVLTKDAVNALTNRFQKA